MSYHNLDKLKYTLYSKEDFLQDDYFIDSHLCADDSSRAYWQRLIDQGAIDVNAYNAAAIQLGRIAIDDATSVADDVMSDLWTRIEESNTKTRPGKVRRIVLAVMGTAACILAISYISLGMSWGTSIEEEVDQFATNKVDVNSFLRSKEVQLIISEDESYIASNESTIDYSNNQIKVEDKIIEQKEDEKSVMNQLVVPYGRRSSLILSDGSELHLNAGTHVMYPSKFAKDKREIFVNGEVYGNIAKDVNRPFVIRTKDLEVKVLGTQLDISAYEDEINHSVTLVTGSVSVAKKDAAPVLLKPNQQVTSSTGSLGLEVKTVDAEAHTAWVKGYYSFKGEKIGVILAKVEKYYGVEIKCSPNIYNLKCTGRLDLKDNLNRVLLGLTKSTPTMYSYDAETHTYSFIYKP